jgi:transcription initiation factor IIE alpha subunit
MNNEPVAWMREDGVIAFHKQKEVDSQGFKWIPLYTHPAKTLTDEEILEIVRLGLDEFRAILRKAQEK